MVYCEPPLNNQYGPPGNFLGGGNNNNHHGGSAHGGGSGGAGGDAGIINSYGASLADGHNGHNSDQDYIDSQVKSSLLLNFLPQQKWVFFKNNYKNRKIFSR